MADTLNGEQRDALIELYIAYFNRAPESGGLQFHADAVQEDLNAGLSFDQALNNRADNFFSAAIDLDVYSPDMTTEAFVAEVYENTLLRPGVGGEAPSDADIAFWTARLDSGEFGRGDLVTQFLDAVPFLMENGTPDEMAVANQVNAVMENRVEVARFFAQPENSGNLSGDAAIAAGRDAIDDVDWTDESVAQAINEIEEGANAGDTFNLTAAGGENLEGTAANDTFTGVIGDSVNDFDTIDGGAGDDTFTVIVDDAGGEPTSIPLTSIETVQARFRGDGDGPNTLSLADADDSLETVAVSNSAEFGQVTDIGGAATDFRVSNQATSVGFGGATAAALSLMVTDVVDADASDVVTMDFDDIEATEFDVSLEDSGIALGIANVDAGTMTAADTVETLSVNSIGDSEAGNTLGVSGTTAMSAITVTGDQNIAIVGGTVNDAADPSDGINVAGEFTADGFAAIETVDATGLSGNLTIDVSNSLEDVTIRGGTGDDTLITGAGNDLLVGGGGDDTLVGGEGDDIFGGGPGDDTLTGGDGNDEFHVDAGVGSDTVTDFAVDDDVVSFLDDGAIAFANSEDDGTRGDGDLGDDDFQTAATFGAIDDADQSVVLLQNDDTFSTSQITGNVEADGEFYLAVDNGDTGNTEIYYDADWSDTGGRELVISLVGVDADSLTQDNFDVYV